MVDAESELMVADKKFPVPGEKERPNISRFFDKLARHEGTMLFVISNDPASLAKFATVKDDFYSGRFRAACRVVLRDAHKTTPGTVLGRQVAAKA